MGRSICRRSTGGAAEYDENRVETMVSNDLGAGIRVTVRCHRLCAYLRYLNSSLKAAQAAAAAARGGAKITPIAVREDRPPKAKCKICPNQYPKLAKLNSKNVCTREHDSA